MTKQSSIQFRIVQEEDIETVVQLSLLAWKPVFESFREILGGNIYSLIWPEWQAGQRQGIETVCKDIKNFTVWVAEADGTVCGFAAYSLNQDSKTAEIHLLAVHPDFQNQNIGTSLTEHVVDKIKEHDINLVIVETGGDPAHAPARRTYEKAGFTGLPLVRFFQDISKEN